MKVTGISLDNAVANLRLLLDKAGVPSADSCFRRDVEAKEEGGMFSFLVMLGGDEVGIDVPGCATERLLDSVSLGVPKFYIWGHGWFWWSLAREIVSELHSSEGDVDE